MTFYTGKNNNLSFDAALAFANELYEACDRDLSGPIDEKLPDSWIHEGKYWISPYFGTRMELETALKLECQLKAWRTSPRSS